MSVTTIKFEDHFNPETDRYETVELPAKYEVCGDCQGRGKSSAYLGAFTRNELDELGQEFIDDYRAGNYDRPCEICNGLRVVAVIDRELCDPDLLKEYDEQMEAQREVAIADASERAYFSMMNL